MSRDEVECLRLQIVELRERVVKLETYVKVVGALVTVIPIALQVWALLRK
jgi:hypothetical protein